MACIVGLRASQQPARDYLKQRGKSRDPVLEKQDRGALRCD
jgi:hypothetical protein